MAKTDKAGKPQGERFIEAAREAECSEDEAVFDETLRRVARAKPSPAKRRDKRSDG